MAEHCFFKKGMLIISVVSAEAVKNILSQKKSKIGTFNMLMNIQYRVCGRNEPL